MSLTPGQIEPQQIPEQAKAKKTLRYGRPLRLNLEFSRVYRSKKSRRSPHFALYWTKTPPYARSASYLAQNNQNCCRQGKPSFRYGITVPHHIKPAVRRNYNKRVIRQLVAPLAAQIDSSMDIIIFARRDLYELPYASLLTEMAALFRRASLLVEDHEGQEDQEGQCEKILQPPAPPSDEPASDGARTNNP